MEVDSGLADGDIVVVNPPDNLVDGRHVRPRSDSTGQQGQQQGLASNGADKGQQAGQNPKQGAPGQKQGAQGKKQGGASSLAANAGGGYRPPPEMQEGFPGSPVSRAVRTPPHASAPSPGSSPASQGDSTRAVELHTFNVPSSVTPRGPAPTPVAPHG
jgi:hypothetical protein